MKTVVLTGCSRGLGLEMARYFAAKGARVFGCGRSENSLAKLRAELGSDHGFTALDVADNQAVKEWASNVVSLAGAPALLINNAAVIAPVKPLWEVEVEDFDSVVDINIKGTANVLRHFLPPMISAGKGVIVNFSSGWGRSTSPDVAAYCASKYAIEGLTQSLAQELPPGLAAVALNPGVIDTDMLRTAFGDSSSHYPTAAEWIKSAGPFLWKLSAKDNGGSLSVPGVPTD